MKPTTEEDKKEKNCQKQAHFREKHCKHMNVKKRDNYHIIKKETKLNKLKKGLPRIIYRFVNSDDENTENEDSNNSNDFEFKIIDTTPQLSVEAEKKE